MKIPKSKRKKALIIVDLQSAFINKRNKYIVNNIKNLIEENHYDVYIESIFYAERGSLWDKQQNWMCQKNNNSHTIKEILNLLKNKNVFHIEKTTKSVFKNEGIIKILKESKIKEIHIVGLQTNDCIIATAFESFDLGFFTYIIEECCEAETSKEHKLGLEILRKQNLTNNSQIAKS